MTSLCDLHVKKIDYLKKWDFKKILSKKLYYDFDWSFLIQSKNCGRKFRFRNILMVCELDYMNICLPPIIEFATPLYLSGVHIEMDFS